MAATEAARELRVIDPPRHCGDCAVFALLEDVIRSALAGGLGRSIEAHEALPPPPQGAIGSAPGGGHRAIARREPIERLAKVRATLYGRLAAIDVARKAITTIARDGDGVARAVQVEIRHDCGVIQKEVQKARETLAGTGLRR